MKSLRRHRLTTAVQVSLLLSLPAVAFAQGANQTTTLDKIEVTGSRIKQTDKVTSAPVAVITRAQIDASGANSIGEFLQDLTASGKALNTQFNSSGNFGYPPDGGGIGAGSAQVDLRNLGSNRVLVLVDGIRWVNESSASGVSGSADLNTIPLAIVDRIEVLEDGASAIYGSDAIAGVVNIITKKRFDGTQVHAKYGSYGHGGDSTEADITIGGGGERFNGVFSASYVDGKSIGSDAWAQSSFAPIGRAGVRHGSSATPQGRFTFCDPNIVDPTQYGYCDAAQEMWYDLALNDGTTVPNYNAADPTGAPGTYHDFSGNDRFAYAPLNLLLTPSKRKSVFASVNYDITDNVSLHAKALYNNRQSANRAAPEPLFVGPYAGTGGIADTITISANNPYNPFGFNLCAVADPANGCPVANLGWVTKRPLEAGPRIFTQDVDTWYVNFGLDGAFNFGDHGFNWDANYVHSENKAEQTFYNGFNMAKVKLALGDPAICAQVPGCVPLDLFGGQARPITQEMLDYIRTTQIDRSKQTLDLISANVTGDMFHIGDRTAAFAAGVEHRKYRGSFDPDPLRQNGESQDSLAFPIDASYSVNELYGEFKFPLASVFDLDTAIRYSDYSTFGSKTTYKAGFRWQPVQDLVVRGTYSTGFRAPNIGELYGLTQFGATLTDPCSNQVDLSDGPNTTPTETHCVALGVPNGFEQANTQITTFTGGNPNLRPETSKSYTLGAVYSPSWGEDKSWSRKLDFELTYFNHKIKDAIQARDIQVMLDNCVDAASTTGFCSIFTRGPSGNLNPPQNFLDNLGSIKTSGVDIKVNWLSPDWSWGHLSAALQSTYTDEYKAVDVDGNVAARAVGIEVDNGSIPEWQTNLQLGWGKGNVDVGWNIRYISEVTEACTDFRDNRADSLTNMGLCSIPDNVDNANSRNQLDATWYHDVQATWNHAFGADGLKLSAGINNVFAKDAPECTSCTLNGYDASTYDLPFRFWYVDVQYKF